MSNNIIKLGIVDDHDLFRKGLITLINTLITVRHRYETVFEAANGLDLMESLAKSEPGALPDLLLLDLNMPGMNGFECITWLRTHYPLIKTIILSMRNDDATLIRSLRLGACSYLTKDISPDDLKIGIDSIWEKGYYYPETMATKLVQNLAADIPTQQTEITAASVSLSDREKRFLALACTEMTYSEIARTMSLSARTIDGYRDALFSKLHVGSRVGLAMWTVRNGILDM
jgi:two-component system, NarL family, invasion response regulator UvrY